MHDSKWNPSEALSLQSARILYYSKKCWVELTEHNIPINLYQITIKKIKT